MRDRRLPKERVRAIQEEICGFLDEEVLKPGGEFYWKVESRL